MNIRPFHHQRPLAAAAAAYGLGVWAGVSFVWRPGWYLAGLALCCASIVLLPRAGRRRVMGVMGAALFLGMLLAGARAHPALPPAGRYQVRGVLAADAALREDGTAAAYLERVEITDGTETMAVSRAYWTYTPDEAAPFLPREGDAVVFSGKVYHPQGRVNPYGFDFRLFLLQKGVAIGLSGAAEASVTGHPGRGLRSLPYQARQWLEEKSRAVFGAEDMLSEALLLGRKDHLPQEMKRSFADAGVAHVLSVSGLHVALLAGVLMLPLRRLLHPKARIFMLGGFLLVYCALLDFSAPVVRASLLMMLAQGRRIVRRAPDPLTALAAAFLLVLLPRPLDLFSAGFQLSFGAVLGIVLLMPVLEKKLGFLRFRFLQNGVGITLAATAGAALPTVQWFHRLSVIGLVINPLVCAAFGVLLPSYALALLVGCVYLPAGQALGAAVSAAGRWLTAGVAALGEWPLAVVRLPALPFFCVAALVLCGWLCTRYIPLPGKKKMLIGAAALALSFGAWHLTACRDVQYIQLAVGQADAALILDGGETALIDTGEHGGDVTAYLLSAGRQADHLFLTHLHKDHCLGVQALLEARVPIGRVYLPEGAEEQQVDDEALALLDRLREMNVPIQFLRAGDTVMLERTKATVTWPYGGAVRPGQDANRYSLVTLWDLDGVKLLTAGDLEGAFEGYAAAGADVLKVAHHGSKSSTGAEFLRAVSPRLALITGSPSSPALPHADTLKRLAEAGVSVYNTGEWGALTIAVRNGEARLTTFLKEKEQP